MEIRNGQEFAVPGAYPIFAVSALAFWAMPVAAGVLPSPQWNLDLQDMEKILHIDSEENIALTVINLLNSNNFNCEELALKRL